jgi:hypothetical protein
MAPMAEIIYVINTPSMALSIKSEEADQLARDLAAEIGETLTEHRIERPGRPRGVISPLGDGDEHENCDTVKL